MLHGRVWWTKVSGFNTCLAYLPCCVLQIPWITGSIPTLKIPISSSWKQLAHSDLLKYWCSHLLFFPTQIGSCAPEWEHRKEIPICIHMDINVISIKAVKHLPLFGFKQKFNNKVANICVSLLAVLKISHLD